MQAHSFCVCLQITIHIFRPPVKWVVRLVIENGHLIFLIIGVYVWVCRACLTYNHPRGYDLCGYVWVNILSHPAPRKMLHGLITCDSTRDQPYDLNVRHAT